MNGDSYSRGSGRRDDRHDRNPRDRPQRRRSRSPRHSSRRDYEVDTYSSSRDYREREREDTYARRERRGDDRGYNDSYSRRDNPRRDDDRGHGRRERDPFEDRGDRGGRGRRDRGDRGDRGDRDRGDRGDRGDRDGRAGGRELRKSKSPAAAPRQPTPDLTNVVSIQVRPRRMTQWDIKPKGYENITAEQAKLSGQFPLPGAPRAAPMDPARLAAFAPASGTAAAAGLKPSHSKQAKRLFVYNIPPTATSETLVEFFNLQLNGLNVISENNPCVSANISADGTNAMLEFKAPQDATMAFALSGIAMEDAMDTGGPDGTGLSIRRPEGYIMPASAEENYMEGVMSDVVHDSPNKLLIKNLPSVVDDEQVLELVQTFGPLHAFVLVKDTGTGQSRGVAFCEYAELKGALLDEVMRHMAELDLGDGPLQVQRASVGVTQAPRADGVDGGVSAITDLARTKDTSSEKSTVIMLLNMTTPDELINPDDYEDLKEDIHSECSKYGTIVEVKIPRPSGARVSPGVGKIFIKFEAIEQAQAAISALAGRGYAQRTVVATFYSEELFNVNAW